MLSSMLLLLVGLICSDSAAVGLMKVPPNHTTPTLVDVDIDPVKSNQIDDSILQQSLGSVPGLLSDRIWPHAIVPITISSQFTETQRQNISQAIAEFHLKTCVRFVTRTSQIEHVLVIPGVGCNSPVGRRVGEQVNVTLGNGCLQHSTILHELMHVIGFEHEHNRPDRDQHVVVHLNNVKRGMEFAFRKRPSPDPTTSGLPYDYRSVLHYPSTAFSKNGHPTITAIDSSAVLGPRDDGFTQLDVDKINRLYNCTRQLLPSTTTTAASGYDSDDDAILKPTKECSLTWTRNPDINNLVVGGNDSLLNKFYICRWKNRVGQALLLHSKSSSEISSSSSFICLVLVNGVERRVSNFELLTNPSRTNIRWIKTRYRQLVNQLNASLMSVDGANSSLSHVIARCPIKIGNDYRIWLPGSVPVTTGRFGFVSVAVNGKEFRCNLFRVLACDS